MLDRGVSETEAEPAHDQRRPVTERLSRYDFTLAVIPAAFLLSTFASHLFGLSARTALVGGSVVGALALVDSLFVHPPQTGRR